MALNPKLTDWPGKRVWLVGASSGIGAALAQELAGRGARLVLTARRPEALAALAIPGALCLPADVTKLDCLQAARAQLLAAWGGVDLVIYLAGDYRPMTAANFDLAVAEAMFAVNFNGAAKLASCVVNDLPVGGGIAFVASVAGYRGLPRALAYGPGKAALIHFAECLHLELAARGVGVWVINPGFVQSRLTAQNEFAMPALLTAEAAATATVDGLGSGKFEIHYPKRFTRVMKLLSLLPDSVYFPLIRRFTGA